MARNLASPKSPPRWLYIFFFVVVALAGLQLVRDLRVIDWSFLQAQPGSFMGQVLQAVAGAGTAASGRYKAFPIEQTNRYQNELGLDLEIKIDGAISDVYLEDLEAEMHKMYVSGMRYITIEAASSSSDAANSVGLLIKAATAHNLVPIILYETDGSPVDFYRTVSETVVRKPFIASIAPQGSDLSGYSGWISDIHNLPDGEYILVATPPLRINNALGVNDVQNNAGVDPSMFDIVLIQVLNEGLDFGIRRSASDPIPGDSDQFRGYRFWAKGNEGDSVVARNWVGSVPAIVIDYRMSDRNTYFNNVKQIPITNAWQQDFLHDKYVEALCYDFGSFSDDNKVIGVVLDRKEMISPKREFTYGDYARLNLCGNNGDYNLGDFSAEFDPKGSAEVCEVENEPAGKTAISRVVCDKDPNGSCRAMTKFTVQIGLPIRHFMCNSAVGTDTNPYMCLNAWVGANTDVGYNHFAQFAAPLDLGGGNIYMMPGLGSAIFNSAEALKYHFQGVKYPWDVEVTAAEGAFYGTVTSYNSQRYIKAGQVEIDKENVGLADIIRDYDPREMGQAYQQVNVCDGNIARVNVDPQNMMYGSELILESNTDSYVARNRQELCYHTWLPDGESRTREQGGNLIQCSEVRAQDCVCDEKDEVAPGVFIQRAISKNLIGQGRCHVSDTRIVDACFVYISGADSYEKSVVYIESPFPAAPKPEIPGAYDALAARYKFLEDEASQRSISYGFNEKLGWKGQVILKAYSDLPKNDRFDDFVIKQARGNIFADAHQDFPGTYFINYDLPLADGDNFSLTDIYYENLGFLDTIALLLDTDLRDAVLPGERLLSSQVAGAAVTEDTEEVPAVDLVTVDEGLSTINAGFVGYNSDAFKEILSATGSPPNAVYPLGFCDPLGEFLVSIGYPVSEACRGDLPICEEDELPAGEITLGNTVCPVKDANCFQGPEGNFSHACNGGRPAFDLYNYSDQTVYAPEDGKVIFVSPNGRSKCSEILGDPSEMSRASLIARNIENQERVDFINDQSSMEIFESYGAIFNYQGESGVVYHIVHSNIPPSETAFVNGQERKAGEPFELSDGSTVRLYHIPGDVETPCIDGAHLHAFGSLDGNENINQYELFEALGCNDINSCNNDHECEGPATVDLNLSGSSSGSDQCVVPEEPGDPFVDKDNKSGLLGKFNCSQPSGAGSKSYGNIFEMVDFAANYFSVDPAVVTTILEIEHTGTNVASQGGYNLSGLYTGNPHQYRPIVNSIGCMGPGQFCSGSLLSFHTPEGKYYDEVLACAEALGVTENVAGKNSCPAIVGNAVCAMSLYTKVRGGLGMPSTAEQRRNTAYTYYGSCEDRPGQPGELYCDLVEGLVDGAGYDRYQSMF